MSIEKVGWINGVKGKKSRGGGSHTVRLDFRWESGKRNWGRVKNEYFGWALKRMDESTAGCFLRYYQSDLIPWSYQVRSLKTNWEPQISMAPKYYSIKLIWALLSPVPTFSLVILSMWNWIDLANIALMQTHAVQTDVVSMWCGILKTIYCINMNRSPRSMYLFYWSLQSI